ncbi:MAG: hypothetical protein Q7S02_03040 [bacterium]|nr:hypothetical protein [bacterium]
MSERSLLPLRSRRQGSILVVVLVALATSFTVAAAIVGLSFSVAQLGSRAVARASALHLAEAGVHYQRWRIAHRPDDASEVLGARTLAFRDATGRAAGTVTITVSTPDTCTGRTTISATAAPSARAPQMRTVTTAYGKPSLASYAFLTNTTLSFGGSGTIDGRIHANSGIRMDANQNTIASSAVATYTCGSGQGCASTGEERPGIWGAGSGNTQGLWRFPVQGVSFSAITADLRTLRDTANTSGVLLPPSGAYGYYLKFKSNGTVDIHRVTNLQRPVWSYDGERWNYESHDLSGVPTVQRTHAIPQESCGAGNLIVVEDNVWVDGIVHGRVTVVARSPDTTTRNARIFLNGSLTLQDAKTDAVGLIAQGDVQFPLVLPDDITISGVLIAQRGRIFRPYYPSTYRPWYIRSSLRLNGSLITNGVAATTWVDQNGNVVSGFRGGSNAFDARYALDPPPFIPARSEFAFLKWNEK